ncbi:MAG TPA: hypothetical protein VFE32_14745 [Puia sp.]|nr:hypothetical protein [Puia sp.]
MRRGSNNSARVQPPGHPIAAAPRAAPAGIGDIIKGVTAKVGIKPCKGCERRAEVLNRLTRRRG